MSKREAHRLPERAGEIGGDIEIDVPVTDVPGPLGCDEGFERLHGRRIAVVLGDDKLPSCVAGQLDHPPSAGRILRDRLFREQVKPVGKGEFGMLQVNHRRRDGQHRVGLDTIDGRSERLKTPLGRNVEPRRRTHQAGHQGYRRWRRARNPASCSSPISTRRAHVPTPHWINRSFCIRRAIVRARQSDQTQSPGMRCPGACSHRYFEQTGQAAGRRVRLGRTAHPRSPSAIGAALAGSGTATLAWICTTRSL